LPLPLFSQTVVLKGHVTDPQGRLVTKASVELLNNGKPVSKTVTGADGSFQLALAGEGRFEVKVEAAGFRTLSCRVSATGKPLEIRLVVESRAEQVTVTAELTGGDVESPDAAMKVLVSQDLLDANPGRPGAPISIPGYPIETASSGIKAPQYMAPGVMGDHGESIAMFMQVGTYMVPINLSANTHGNGYADPNFYIAEVIESVKLDAGAFNVLEGNHALNLAATYGLRSHVDPFLTFVGDQRDITAIAGMSPSPSSYIALEGSYGNGFMDRLEHRKQFKFNGGKVWHTGDHTVTLSNILYYGVGHVAGLTPMYGYNFVDASHGWTPYSNDTIDVRQKDQTHTAILALNDVWKLGKNQELQTSGFFRSYNLLLFSDFGLGLIRQSEWRTVGGASSDYINHITPNFTLLAGVQYEREAPRRDNLDHYNYWDQTNPYYYGPFTKVIASDVTIAPLTPYAAVEGDLGKHLRYYLGWRQDYIYIDQHNIMPSDVYVPAYGTTFPIQGFSFSEWKPVADPKSTITYLPGDLDWVPTISASFGMSYYTEDPRNFVNSFTPATVVQRARTYQVVANKMFHKTELRLTLSHETQGAELGKIDSDQGLLFPLGPGYVRYLAATLNQHFTDGSLQVTWEQADARLINSNYGQTDNNGNPLPPSNAYSLIPEAPRLITDIVGTYRKLPFQLEAKAEFEYVGRKVVGAGCDENKYESYIESGAYPVTGTGPYLGPNNPNSGNGLPSGPYGYSPNNPALLTYSGCYGVPTKEFRLALSRPFLNRRLSIGLNMMIASGYTGQTTENFGWHGPGNTQASAATANAPGFGPNPSGTNHDLVTMANPINEVVGVRIPSYASLNLTYHFGVNGKQ
jgi:hypothetical protein